MAKKVVLQIDPELRVAYIKLQQAPVKSTVELTEDVLVDLDDYGMVVGIEVLDLNTEIPMRRLAEELHIHSDVIELLQRIRPSISGFVSQVSTASGSVTATNAMLTTA